MDYVEELQRFSDYLDKRVQPGTKRMYIHALRCWFERLDGSEPSAELAQQYIDRLSETKSASTASLRAHAIMRWFRWRLVQVRLDCPTVRIGQPEYLNMKQFNRLLLVCSTTLEKTLIVLLFDTAVRISELLNLELDCIDWENRLISVIRKGGRREEVNISEKGLALLNAWLEARSVDSKKVFMDLSYWDARDMIRRVGRRAKITVRPHMLRHSRAIQMLMAGATLHDVQLHLGHTSIATTANIYGRFKALDLRRRIPDW